MNEINEKNEIYEMNDCGGSINPSPKFNDILVCIEKKVFILDDCWMHFNDALNRIEVQDKKDTSSDNKPISPDAGDLITRLSRLDTKLERLNTKYNYLVSKFNELI